MEATRNWAPRNKKGTKIPIHTGHEARVREQIGVWTAVMGLLHLSNARFSHVSADQRGAEHVFVIERLLHI